MQFQVVKIRSRLLAHHLPKILMFGHNKLPCLWLVTVLLIVDLSRAFILSSSCRRTDGAPSLVPSSLVLLILDTSSTCRRRRTKSLPAATPDGKSMEATSDDDEEEEEHLTPYRNRSLTWTNKFRTLIPYETVRRKVIGMGFYCKQDWDEHLQDGGFGPYIPNYPDEMYVDDWVSWDEFLGLMRPHEDARQVVQQVLHLATIEDYTAFVEEDPKRASYLRMPWKPHLVYKNKGWVSYDYFFGTMQ
jgi:hypothetical protein